MTVKTLLEILNKKEREMEQRTNREAWLTKMVELMRPIFREKSYSIEGKKILVSCGYPKSKSALGEVHQVPKSEEQKEERFEIFISPKLSDSMEVCGVLVHELVHVAVGFEAKHGKPFAQAATDLGLQGPMRATTHTDESRLWCGKLLIEIGEPYPHDTIPAREKGGGSDKPKTTFKAFCDECGYTFRISKKWLDVGTPQCPLHGDMAVEN